ncbi:hypothetical protein NEF87_000198 [Candidatus Lokiarchaeum ossiferum]|uniref:Uncharacterized protein n=1 Tax=Candidatus Lokiarchaeum ossiferum TaxID=2951803 RepID=A0ABY6HK63_9ARCH|nr:hypothetical protein NEF87_000198 [Candidatus Lokiarchaeum sp. B-35]
MALDTQEKTANDDPIEDSELDMYYKQYVKLKQDILKLQQEVKERLKKLGLDSLIKILGY